MQIRFLKGSLSLKDKISPSYINLNNPKFIEIDGIYYSGLIVIDYTREYKDIILKNLINTNINMNISIFYEKQDTYKTIKDLTYYIGNVGVDIKSGNENRQDIDIASYSYNDAKYIRKEMQVNNEDLYFLYMYINIFAQNENELYENINKAEGILELSGLVSKKGNFRQEAIFKACIPELKHEDIIKNVSKRNVLTSSLVATYPFISSNIYEENGIFVGTNIYNNSMIFLDRFDKEKYKNSNMCIFGTSGSGKSYYTKLQIIRYRLRGINQYVIDPEREYEKLCNNLDGTIIKIGSSSNTYINIFDIREDSIEEEKGFLMNKISKLRGFFSLVFGNLDEEKISILEECIIKTYEKKGITFDDSSLYKKKNGKYIFKDSDDMPILEDFYNVLITHEKGKIFENKMYPFIKGSLKFFNNYTNINLDNKLIIADIYELGEENLKYGMYIFIDLFWDKIKNNRSENKLIYLDEIWRLIGITSNSFVAGFIYKIFKTIRKYGGGAVAITQDISDLFSLEDGLYGKSILNNSSIKTFFYIEEENILVLEKYSNLTEKEKIEIKSLKRGENLSFIGENHVLIKIEASEIENEII